MLCWFLLGNKVNQLYVYIYLSLSDLPPTSTVPPILVITEHQAELPVLLSMFPLAIYFTHGSVYMSIPISPFIPHPLPSTMSTHPFSVTASPFLFWKQVQLYHFSRYHIYELMYNIVVFFLSDLLHSI